MAQESDVTLIRAPGTLHVGTCGISIPADRRISFYANDVKPVMWITPDGKIHVDPDAPADETAREVCRLLQEHVLFPVRESGI